MTVEGTLHAKRIMRRRHGANVLGNLMADTIAPRFYAEPIVYLIGPNEGHYTLKGKVVKEVSHLDDGRQCRVTGQLEVLSSIPRPGGEPRERGKLTRASIEWLGERVTEPEPISVERATEGLKAIGEAMREAREIIRG